MNSKQSDSSADIDGAIGADSKKLPAPIEVEEYFADLARETAKNIIPEPQLDSFATQFSKAFIEKSEFEDGPSSIIISEQIARLHSGPLPSPETLGEYEKIKPGSMERIIRMAENDQQSFLHTRYEQQKSDNFFRIFSYCGGFLALVLILACGVFLASNNHTEASLGVFAIGVASVISVLVNAWKKKN